MRQLNNTWTLERISTFSGSPKGEKSYEFWQYKIHCLLNETSTDLIWSDSISFPQISERKSSHHPHESRTRSNNRQHHSENKLHLIHAFWDGLSSDLKDLSGYIHDTILSFDELRSELYKTNCTGSWEKKSKQRKESRTDRYECNSWRRWSFRYGWHQSDVTQKKKQLMCKTERWSPTVTPVSI